MPSDKCPRCGRKGTTAQVGWYCHACKMYFDGDPDEGGDYFTDPSRRLEKQEEWKARQRKRR